MNRTYKNQFGRVPTNSASIPSSRTQAAMMNSLGDMDLSMIETKANEHYPKFVAAVKKHIEEMRMLPGNIRTINEKGDFEDLKGKALENVLDVTTDSVVSKFLNERLSQSIALALQGSSLVLSSSVILDFVSKMLEDLVENLKHPGNHDIAALAHHVIAGILAPSGYAQMIERAAKERQKNKDQESAGGSE